MSRPRLIALLLALITLAAFLPATQYAFINYDDNDYVSANPDVQRGLSWAGVKWAFTTLHAENWHPLTWLSHMTDCELFGLNPGAHHFVNVMFHAANAVLLFVVLLRLTGAQWPAAFVAALFAWHPLHVESVVWIAERKDVLSTFFALLTLLCYARFVQAKCRRSFWLAVLFFALGLLAKPMLVTLPFVLVLLDFWPLQRLAGLPPARTLARLVAEKWPFFLLTAASCALTFLAQSHKVNNVAAVVSLEFVPLHYRLQNVPLAYATYLLKLAWPTQLAVFYPLANVLPAARVATAVALLLLGSGLAWRTRHSRPYFLLGWLWFLGMLVPVIGLVQVGGAAWADRYSYLPGVGIFLIAAFAARDLLARFPALNKPAAAAAVVILAACLVATEKQLPVWRNSETLFRHALAVTADNDVSRNNLAVTLQEQGNLPAALVEFQAAARLAPERSHVHGNLAGILGKLERHAEALAEYREAVRLAPSDAKMHTSVGIELAALERYDEALAAFATAKKLDPKYAWTSVETARVYFKLGRDAEAVAELRAALRLAPEDYQILTEAAHDLAANENAAARDGQAAMVLATKANILSGGNQPIVFDVIGMACAELGDFTNAQAAAQSALDITAALKMTGTESIRQRLELYQRHQPWRESLRATNQPGGK